MEYFEFEKMESRDSFKVMESFIDGVNDNVLQENLVKAQIGLNHSGISNMNSNTIMIKANNGFNSRKNE